MKLSNKDNEYKNNIENVKMCLKRFVDINRNEISDELHDAIKNVFNIIIEDNKKAG